MKKMLITDDSSGWLKYHRDNIERLFQNKFEIETAASALEANEKLYLNMDKPYDYILTDLQMETNFLPLLAGEWLVEQIQMHKEYAHTKIIIISASPNIKYIAERYSVDYIPKSLCREPDNYKLHIY